MEDKEKIELLEKEIKLLESIVELQKRPAQYPVYIYPDPCYPYYPNQCYPQWTSGGTSWVGNK